MKDSVIHLKKKSTFCCLLGAWLCVGPWEMLATEVISALPWRTWGSQMKQRRNGNLGVWIQGMRPKATALGASRNPPTFYTPDI